MARRDSRGRFLKGARKRSAPKSRALARRSSSSPTRRRRRGGGDGGKLSLRTLGPPIIAGGVMGALVNRWGKKSDGLAAQVIELAKKVPGQKTFGTAPALGVIALGIDRFVYRHRYLRLFGVAGLVIGAYDAGSKSDLKWVGSVGDADDGMAVR